MPSTIELTAIGQTGEETAQLIIDGVVVATYEHVPTSGMVYTYESDETVTADQVRVAFINDRYEPENGIDYNLTVPQIAIDGEVFLTDDPDVFSTGVWTPEDGVTEGFGRGDSLAANGYFQYAADDTPPPPPPPHSGDGSVIDITMFGETGNEIAQLLIDGEVVATFENIATQQQVYSYTADGAVTPEQVRVAFINDRFEPENGIDNNLTVPQIAIDGDVYITADENVFSTGVWTAQDGVQDGFGRGDRLAANGFFEYSDDAAPPPPPPPPSGDGSVIVITMRGETGNETAQLIIDGEIVATYANVSDEQQEYTYVADDTVTPDQVRVAFVNDRWEPQNGIDYNLYVPQIAIDDVVYPTDDESVFSTGVWTAEDGIEEGFGRGDRLAGNGFFQYAAPEPLNTPPVADDDAFIVQANDTDVLLQNPLNNDTDADDDTLTIVAVSDPANGTAVIDPDVNGILYTPEPGFTGTDTFTYTVDDGNGDTATATITITVPEPTNTPPVAVNDAYSTDEDQTLTVPIADGLLVNDIDADGDLLSARVETGPSNGTLTLNANGTFIYTPNADFEGVDTFTYIVNDGTEDSASPATVDVMVDSVNDAPVTVDDIYTVDEEQTLTASIAEGVLSNDIDAEGDALTATLVDDVQNGTLLLNGDGSFVYTPDADFTGTDSFTYVANDSTDDSAPATVTIDVGGVNDAPVAVDDTFSGDEDTDITGNVLANDTDAENNPLTATLVADVQNGTLTLNPDGSFTYTPTADFDGTDTFTYLANDGTDDSASPATVTLTVGPVNDPAVIAGDTDGEVFEDGVLVASGNLTVADIDSPETFVVQTGVATAYGTFSIDAAGAWQYDLDTANTAVDDLDDGETLTDSITVASADGTTATVSITIDGTTDAFSLSGQNAGFVVDLAARTSLEAGNILLLGDSYTEGIGAPGGYRPGLWNNLTSDEDLWVDFVGASQANPGNIWHDLDHQGQAGIRATQILADLPTTPADVTVLLIGTNDILNSATPQDTLDNVVAIIDGLETANPGMSFVVGTPPQVEGGSAFFNPQLQQFTDLLLDLDRPNVEVVDLSFLNDDDFPDDIHPEIRGYADVADAFTTGLLSVAAGDIANGTIAGSNLVTLSGSIGAVIGSQGGDRLSGDANANGIDGGSGDDWIEGRGGDDDLFGNSGRDQFVFGTNDGNDTIFDFEVDTDFLLFDGALPGDVTYAQVDDDVVATYVDTTVTILNTNVGDIDPGLLSV